MVEAGVSASGWNERLQAFDDSEALGDDQCVISDLLVAPERFVSAAPVGDGLKAFSLVAHDNYYFSIHAAAADDIDILVRVFMIPVDHGVCESLEYGDFNFTFRVLGDAKSPHEQPNEPHESFYQGRDRSYVAG